MSNRAESIPSFDAYIFGLRLAFQRTGSPARVSLGATGTVAGFASLVTEATVLALGREAVIKQLDRGTRFMTDVVWAHPGLIADPPPGDFRKLPYDPEGARALVAESGFDTNQTICYIKWSDPGPRDWSDRVRAVTI